MATTIRWFAGDGAVEIQPAESGNDDTVGYFGANFGFSIRVGEYNNTTFCTNDNGTTNFGALPNLRYANTSGAYVGSELTATELLQIDNSEATIFIRLNTDSAVQTQNAAFRAFDRSNINNNPSGVICYAAEINKPSPSIRGSGDTYWTQIYGSGSVLNLADQTTASGVHTWYIGLTATPTSIGAKTFSHYFECEFI